MMILLSTATPTQIDWLVALIEGYDQSWLTKQLENPNLETRSIPRFSTSWSDGGPIIDREWDNLMSHLHKKNSQHGDFWHEYMLNGAPVLEAFMRAYAVIKFGDSFEAPDTLL